MSKTKIYDYTLTDKFLVYLSFILQIITTIMFILILIKSNCQLEPFTTNGNVLYGDIPEKVVVGDTEYDNLLYDKMIEHWTPTNEKYNGYTSWVHKY